MRWTTFATRTALAGFLAMAPFALAGTAAAEDPVWTPGEQAQPEEMAPESISVTGTIEAAEEDLLGRTKSVKIVSPDMGTYVLDEGEKAEELKDYVGRTVTITARRVTDDEGRSVLSVQDFQLHEG